MTQHEHAPHDHLMESAQMEKIGHRMQAYLHLARRMVVDQFGPEAGGTHDFVLATINLAGAMAGLEAAEIIAASQDEITEAIEDTAL